MPVKMEIEGVEEIQRRMRRFPHKYKRALRKTLDASRMKLHELTPEYPEPPADSSYKRTGTLGRTLGQGQGNPQIYETKIQGKRGYAEYGTRLDYAPYVIGDRRQAEVHQGRWWIMGDVARKAEQPIIGLFKAMARGLARWLERKI
jgi:hypothetical protein